MLGGRIKVDEKKVRNVNFYSTVVMFFLVFFFSLLRYYHIFFLPQVIQSLVMALVVIIGIFYAFIVNNRRERIGCSKGYFLFIIFSFISTLINWNNTQSAIEIFCNLGFAYGCYLIFCCSLEMIFSIRKLIKIVLFMGGIYSLLFLRYIHQGLRLEAGAVNSIYYIVLLLPFVLASDSKKIRIAGFISLLILAVVSNKRTAFLVVIAGIAVYFIVYFCSKNISLNKKMLCTVTVVACVFFLNAYFEKIISSLNIDIFERFSTINEDGGSGRDVIWEGVIEGIKQFNLIEIISGRGFNGVYNYAYVGTSAHNDFIEVLYDYGVLGLICYLYFIIEIIMVVLKMKKIDFNLFAAGMSSLVIFFIMSLFSHLQLYPTYFIYFLLFWAVCNHYENSIESYE